MPGKQVTELDALPSFTDTSLLPVHNGAGLKKGLLSQLANYLGKKFSNPNLLINPDFKINQRGATSYESASSTTIKNVYSVDRWSLYGHKLAVNPDKSITLSPTSYSNGTFSQILEDAVEDDVTIQVYVVGISGSATVLAEQSNGTTTSNIGNLKNGLNVFHFNKGIKKLYIRVLSGTLTLKYAKVEQGAVATSFIAPNYAEEILKCQRFYVVLESSLAGYGANNAIYIPFARGVYMRSSRNVIFTGNNKQTFLRVNGTGKQISFSTTNGYANNQYVRVYTNPVDTSLNNTAIGVDLNDTVISVDAEIY